MGGRYAAPRRRRRQPVNWAATVAGCLVAGFVTQMTPAQAETRVQAAAPRQAVAAAKPAAAKATTKAAPKAAPKAPTTSSTIQVHYAAPVRTSSRVIDIVRTLDRVRAKGSRTYSYLIYPRAGYRSAQDWATLPAFLAAAKARGIAVQVTLTPPSSTSSLAAPCTADMLLPYKGRYDVWMAELGKLARKHANLTAVMMDDYSYSSTNRLGTVCPSFPPGTLTRWNAILTKNAGRPLRVLPVLYLRDLASKRAIYPFIKKEAPAIVWPFTQIGSGLLEQQYKAIMKNHPTLKVWVMVYATGYKGQVPTPATVAAEIATAKRLKAPGVVIYQEKLGS
ncbi:MAG: hypothetical protein JNL54_03745 [Kineosporiaceae bacterium]|nr:hypothetical protein [Kineosporiaceae bacterium]